MKVMYQIPCVSTVKNNGDRAEENFGYAITGKPHHKDSVAFDRDSDVMFNGIGYSVKSNHFTLASGNLLKGDTLTEKLDHYFSIVHSDFAVYVDTENNAYIMDMVEFRVFLETFATLERESQKNGGMLKVRCRAETKKMRAWLASQI